MVSPLSSFHSLSNISVFTSLGTQSSEVGKTGYLQRQYDHMNPYEFKVVTSYTRHQFEVDIYVEFLGCKLNSVDFDGMTKRIV